MKPTATFQIQDGPAVVLCLCVISAPIWVIMVTVNFDSPISPLLEKEPDICIAALVAQ